MRCDAWFGSNTLARVALVFIVSCGCFGNCGISVAADGSDVAEALKLAPKEALGAVVVSKLSALDGKLTEAGAALGIHLPGSHLETAKGMLGIQEGLDENRAMIAVVLPPVAEESALPFVALAVPVTDYDKFIANFSTVELEDGFSRVFAPHFGQADDAGAAQSMWAIKKDKYALLMLPYALAGESDEAQVEMRKKLKKLLVDRKAELLPEFAKAKDWLAKQDVGAVLTTAGVKLSMGAATQGLQQMKVVFDQIAGMQLGENEAQAAMMRRQMEIAKKGFDMYEALFGWIDREVGQLLVGVRIDEDSTLRIASRASFAAPDKWKEIVAKLPAASGKPFAGLPAGEYVGAFEGMFSGSGADFFTNYSLEMLKAMGSGSEEKLSDEEWKRVSDSMAKSMEGVRSMSIVLGVPKAGQSLYGAMTGVVKVEDSTKYLDNYAESIKALAEVSKRVKIPYFGQYDVKKIELDGSPALEVVMDYSGMLEMMEQQPGGTAARPIIELMLGKGGKISVFIQAVDKTTVAMAWGDQAALDRAKASLKSPEAGLSADAGANATLAMLPKGSQWVVLANPAGIVGMVQSFMEQIAGEARAMPDFGDVPPIGLGVRLDGDALEKEFVVPGKTIEGFIKARQGAGG